MVLASWSSEAGTGCWDGSRWRKEGLEGLAGTEVVGKPVFPKRPQDQKWGWARRVLDRAPDSRRSAAHSGAGAGAGARPSYTQPVPIPPSEIAKLK